VTHRSTVVESTAARDARAAPTRRRGHPRTSGSGVTSCADG